MGRTGTFIALAVMVLVGVFGGVASWASSGNATRPVAAAFDQISLQMTGNDPRKRCFRVYFPDTTIKWLALDYSTTDMSCYSPPRRYEGYLQVSHMGEQFDETGCDWIGLNRSKQVVRGVVFATHPNLPRDPKSVPTGYETYLYRISFVARTSPKLRKLVNTPVGTSRGYDIIMLAERILSVSQIRDVEAWEDGARSSETIRASCDSPH